MKAIVHVNYEKKEYFYSTDHIQEYHSKKPYPEHFGPMTVWFPHVVAPRPTLPSGVVESLEDFQKVYLHDCKEIPNPDPDFQPKTLSASPCEHERVYGQMVVHTPCDIFDASMAESKTSR
jgi:hypothetical protein